MATVIERERSNDSRPIIVDRGDDSSGAGWAVALVVIVAALVVAGFVWARYRAPAAAPASTGASINVSLPSTGSTGSTDTGGTSGGSTGGSAPTGGTSGTGY